MINYSRHILDNGLTLLHHQDNHTRMVAVNLLYKVGSSDEQVPLTGLAHLLEHLMFAGTDNILDFDRELQRAGGENNAWTGVDATNYYDVLPACNLDTALWLERDRLENLAVSEQAFLTQQSVVLEEFKQRCINAPYGDLNHVVADLAYTAHPYKWPAIGRSLDDVEALTLDDVRAFHRRHYQVNNMIMCISGNVTLDQAIERVEHWFGDLDPHPVPPRHHPDEPMQSAERVLHVGRDVPHTVVTYAYHMCGRSHQHYHAADILSDVLGNGKSSRFYSHAVLRDRVFTDLDAAVSGTIDNGLFLIRGRVAPGINSHQAIEAIDIEIQELLDNGISTYETQKYINKHISTERFERVGYLQQAMRLCMFEQLGNVERIHDEEKDYLRLTPDDLHNAAIDILRHDNRSIVIYGPEQNQ